MISPHTGYVTEAPTEPPVNQSERLEWCVCVFFQNHVML